MSALRPVTGLLLKEIFRKKDFYVALILGAVIVAYAASLRFYDVSKISRYLLETGLTLVFGFSAILTVALAARQFPSEKESKTLEVFLAKPVSRLDFLLSKWAGSFAAGSTAFLVFYAGFLVAAASRMDAFHVAVTLETAFLFLLSLLVLSAMASALSYYLTLSATVTLTLVLYVLMNAYGATLRQAGDALGAAPRLACLAFYYVLPHFEFFDLRQRFIHEWGPVSPGLLLALALYAALYAAAFLAAAWAGFKRRTL